MIGKTSIDKMALQELYRRNKDYLIPILVIVVCFFLLIKITMPQIGTLSERQQSVVSERSKLATLNNNLVVLSSLNSKTLDSQFELASNAYPSEKNFAGVLNAVSLAAGKANVFLGDYEFQVGDLSKIQAGQKTPSLELSLFLNGGVGDTVKFINELSKSFPISEISDIEVTKNRSKLTVSFYYKPFVSLSDNYLPIHVLPNNYLDTLKNLSTWNNPNLAQVSLPASKSASTTGF